MGIDIAGPVSSTLEVAPATPEELAETGRRVEAAGARWLEARLDRRDLPALRAAAEQARAAFGRLDILFANAGIQAFKPILDWQDADWQDTIDVNLTGTCNAIRAVAPHLVRKAADASSSPRLRKDGTAPSSAPPIPPPNGASSGS